MSLIMLLTSFFVGKNKGEKRRVYKDGKGKKFYYSGTPNKPGKHDYRQNYLEPYTDKYGNQRSPNASAAILAQFTSNYGMPVPQSLFVDDEVWLCVYIFIPSLNVCLLTQVEDPVVQEDDDQVTEEDKEDGNEDKKIGPG